MSKIVSRVGILVSGLAIMAFLGIFLKALQRNPYELPSTLVDHALPSSTLLDAFNLNETVSILEEFKGKVFIIHVLASWCEACREEHHEWIQFADLSKAPLVAVMYKDKPEIIQSWMEKEGNPYKRVLLDPGITAIEWGVYGTPEVLVVDQAGILRKRLIGIMNKERFEKEVGPLIDSLLAKGAS